MVGYGYDMGLVWWWSGGGVVVYGYGMGKVWVLVVVV